MPRYQPSEPRSVPGPASIPRIRTTTITQAASVTPTSPVAISGRNALAAIVDSLMWRVSTIRRRGQTAPASHRVTSYPSALGDGEVAEHGALVRLAVELVLAGL